MLKTEILSIVFRIFILTISLVTGCAVETEKSTELYQVSTLQALILGDYDGSITSASRIVDRR